MIVIEHRAVDGLGPAIDALAGQLTESLRREALQRSLSVVQAAVMRSTRDVLAKDPTGALMRSWEVEVGADGMSGSVRSGSPYAAIHERGGTILPKRRKLAIPVGLRRSERGLWPRFDPTPMRAWRSRSGKLLLWDVSRTPAVPRYLLVDRVTIPATRYISTAVESSMDDAADAYMATVSAALDAAGGE